VYEEEEEKQHIPDTKGSNKLVREALTFLDQVRQPQFDAPSRCGERLLLYSRLDSPINHGKNRDERFLSQALQLSLAIHPTRQTKLYGNHGMDTFWVLGNELGVFACAFVIAVKENDQTSGHLVLSGAVDCNGITEGCLLVESADILLNRKGQLTDWLVKLTKGF